MKTIGFFNNKGGVGKTSMVYHVAWMLADLGVRVVAVDLDPQANLTGVFLPEERLEAMWGMTPRPTIFGAVAPPFRSTGDILDPVVARIADDVGLVPGDLDLSGFEDALSNAWPRAGDGDEGAFRLLSAFSRVIARAGESFGAAVALVDVGPNLGALNRAALLACDAVVVPVGADLFSLQGLRNMGPTLRRWRQQWVQRRASNPAADLALPDGLMQPIGYVVMRHSVRLDRPVRAFENWIGRLPAEYRQHVLNAPTDEPSDVEGDPNCLARLKDYRSLMPMAQEARKPMFHLRAADGAFGSHQQAANDCWHDFNALTRRILTSADLALLITPAAA